MFNPRKRKNPLPLAGETSMSSTSFDQLPSCSPSRRVMHQSSVCNNSPSLPSLSIGNDDCNRVCEFKDMLNPRKRKNPSTLAGETFMSSTSFDQPPSCRPSRHVVQRSSVNNNLPSLPSLYIDNGDCNMVCEFCGAYFWFDERSISYSVNLRPKYTQCCKRGQVVLPYPKTPNAETIRLYQQTDFLSNIRSYNSMFSMTSFGAKVDDSINNGSGPYVFKIEGQIHHYLGSMCPLANEKPRFLQMYIYDTENELSNRLSVFSSDSQSRLRQETILFLMNVLETSNELVKLFRTARDICSSNDVPNFSICLYGSQNTVSYDRPVPGTIGAILPDGDSSCTNFDIIIRYKEGGPQRISKLHPLYMALQYPLLFLQGESGWSPDMALRVAESTKDRKLSMNMYYSYLLHDRFNVYTHLLHGGRLLQQFIVDAYVCIEQSRLDYIRQNQNTFRTEFLQGIHDAVQQGDIEGRSIGKRMILPSSFIGGPRYMYKHYLDALAICRVHGNPQYFITFTCNVKWPEIQRYMSQYPSLKVEDRPDIIARVFEIKVKLLTNFLKTKKPFGEVAADLYTIEFQKRGLPHCHLLLWVTQTCKIRNPEEVDKYISAEIPDPIRDPDLYKVVTDLMIHGPCGLLRPTSPCMSKGSCTKNFPKDYEQKTFFDKNGYVHYKRNHPGFIVNKNDIMVDNGYVVPYNRDLCLHFMAHINVEYCGWSMLIKYLFKYISKGADRIRFKIQKLPVSSNTYQNSDDSHHIDEIQHFVDSRFICPHEASWRILNFSIHDRNPPVQVLSVHLESMQNVTFKDNDHLNNVVHNAFLKRTTLTEWLQNNRFDANGRHLKYIDYLFEYRWDSSSKNWIRRGSKRTPAIGRLVYIHPSCGETFFLRMLLHHQKGCQSFKCIRTVHGELCPTYRAACEKLGLLENDQEWSHTFNEAACWATASELRSLFTHMLLYCEISNPLQLWNEQWHKMSDDMTHNYNILNTDYQMQSVLYELELLLRTSDTSKSLADFGLPIPMPNFIERLRNRLLMEEKNYDREQLALEHQSSLPMLNPEQLGVYDDVMTSIDSNKQVLGFVYGHGGTGKTFLWRTIISALRSKGDIVLAVAASGIASLLLPSGRTAHSRFKIPLDLTDESLCNIKKKTHLAQLIMESSLIIWDEAPMNDRKCFESLNKSLQDLLNNTNMPFGGKSILLGGDFRQTLPIIPKVSKASILASTLPNSHLWRHFKIYKLTQNMRLERPNLSLSERNSIAEFSSWLIALGDGKLGTMDKDDPENTKIIQIPTQHIIPFKNDALNELIQFIYDVDTLQYPSAAMLSRKAIVCPKNDTASEINQTILNMCPGTSNIYNSIDSILPKAGDHGDTEMLYPTEYLNLLDFNGLPPHCLELKVNSPVILLRNLNPTAGLCNGTRLIITQLLPRIIEAEIITGTTIGHRVYIPRISLIYQDKELPYTFKRKQFPLKLCYAMTINKSQGQSLDKIGVYLPQPVFGHGQLYVAMSRATTPNALKVLVVPYDKNNPTETKNIVYSDFLDSIVCSQ